MFLALILFLHLTQDGQLELEAGFVPPTVQGSALLAVGTQRAVLVGIEGRKQPFRMQYGELSVFANSCVNAAL